MHFVPAEKLHLGNLNITLDLYLFHDEDISVFKFEVVALGLTVHY